MHKENTTLLKQLHRTHARRAAANPSLDLTFRIHSSALLYNRSFRNTIDGYIAAGVFWYYQLAFVHCVDIPLVHFQHFISHHGGLSIHVLVPTLALILSTDPIDSD
jgi:hypothetical protein